MNFSTKLLTIVFTLTFLTSCSDDDNENPTPKNDPPVTITSFAKSNSNYSLLASALEATKLDTVLDDTDTQYTVFAPDNDALTKFLIDNGFPNGLDDINTEDEIALVKNILLNHVIAGAELKANDVVSSAPNYLKNAAVGPNNFGGDPTNLSTYYNVNSDKVIINGDVTVTSPDAFDASNGVIHAIDKVIGLPTIVTFATADPNFSSLVGALTTGTPNTDFVGILSKTASVDTDSTKPPFTVFAPDNNAFAKITDPIGEMALTNILLHHVVSGANIVSGNLSDGIKAPSLNGEFTINLPGNNSNPAKITDGAGNMDINIVSVDIQAINGVIHVTESVLIPAP